MLVDSIAEGLFFTTVRIDTVGLDGAAGSGTGFIYAHKISETHHVTFVVSNKHVVEGVRTGTLTFHQANDKSVRLGQGYRLEIEGWPSAWFGHPAPDIDIAVVPFVPLQKHAKDSAGIDLFFRCIDSEMAPSPAQLAQLDAIESVTFVGYPNGVWDSTNLLPVARRGTTASPINVDFQGTPRFLIDASVFGGSSGSPVFIFNQGMYTEKSGSTTMGSRALFVGVIAAVFFRTELNELVAVPIPTHTRPMAQQREMIDLGLVFKARTVAETVQEFLKSKGHV